VRPGRAADHSPPSSAAVMGHTGPVTGSLLLTSFRLESRVVSDGVNQLMDIGNSVTISMTVLVYRVISTDALFQAYRECYFSRYAPNYATFKYAVTTTTQSTNLDSLSYRF